MNMTKVVIPMVCLTASIICQIRTFSCLMLACEAVWSCIMQGKSVITGLHLFIAMTKSMRII